MISKYINDKDILLWSPNPARLTIPAACNSSHTLESRLLTTRMPHCSIAPLAPECGRQWDVFWIVDATPQANILAALQISRTSLKPEGAVIIQFATESGEARMPDWKSYWSSISERLGLSVARSAPDLLILQQGNIKPRWDIKLADESDIENIRTLFKSIFGHEMSPKLWEWKYGHGRGNAVLAYRDGALVAHYGGMFRNILLKEASEWAIQASDVMVHPSARGAFTHRGVFFMITTTWGEMFGPLEFGFPTTRAMRLGERLGLYKSAGTIKELRWPTQGAKKLPWSTQINPIVKADAAMQRQVNKLWQTMHESMHDSAIGVRDWDWLERRYLQHPTREYQIFSIRQRWTRSLQGIFVVLKHDDAYELMDMISTKSRIPLLIQSVRRLALDLGASSIFTWITKNHLETLNYDAPAQSDTGIEIPSDAWTGSPGASDIIDRWWLMPGDTDFR